MSIFFIVIVINWYIYIFVCFIFWFLEMLVVLFNKVEK